MVGIRLGILIVSVVNLFLILLTYLWSEMDSVTEVENRIRDRLESNGLRNGKRRLKFDKIQARADTSARAKLISRLRLKPQGNLLVDATLKNTDPEVSAEFREAELLRFAREVGLDVDCDILDDTDDAVSVRIEIDGLESRKIDRFLGDLDRAVL